jgi:8-oxo-dGTP pyrophosphatase MutT (NUDIX family)
MKEPNTSYKLRPTYYFDDDLSKPVRAAGVMFYRQNKYNTHFLMIMSKNYYEDFGGRSDKIDTCIEDIASREAEEESNLYFNKDKLYEKITKSTIPPIYYSNSKYVIFFVELKENIDVYEFGDEEFHCNIKRTVEWVSYKKLVNTHNLHARLWFEDFYTTVKNINENNISN